LKPALAHFRVYLLCRINIASQAHALNYSVVKRIETLGAACCKGNTHHEVSEHFWFQGAQNIEKNAIAIKKISLTCIFADLHFPLF
jgi:hypothetical protein